MKKINKLKLSLVLVLYFWVSQVLAKSVLFEDFAFPPSKSDCEFYTELNNKIKCGKSNYLNEVQPLCEKYLLAENSLGSEIQIFFPNIRYCLQNELLKKLDENFCQNLNQISIESHVQCYVDNGYCELSPISQWRLIWITRSKIFKQPWLTTAHLLNGACADKKRDTPTANY